MYIGVKELVRSKKLSNTTYYNIYQNSRFYRLLFLLLVACIVILVTFLKWAYSF